VKLLSDLPVTPRPFLRRVKSLVPVGSPLKPFHGSHLLFSGACRFLNAACPSFWPFFFFYPFILNFFGSPPRPLKWRIVSPSAFYLAFGFQVFLFSPQSQRAQMRSICALFFAPSPVSPQRPSLTGRCPVCVVPLFSGRPWARLSPCFRAPTVMEDRCFFAHCFRALGVWRSWSASFGLCVPDSFCAAPPTSAISTRWAASLSTDLPFALAPDSNCRQFPLGPNHQRFRSLCLCACRHVPSPGPNRVCGRPVRVPSGFVLGWTPSRTSVVYLRSFGADR